MAWTATSPPDWWDCTSVLNRRLLQRDPSPILLGFSGGGDSLALLRLTHEWAIRSGRRLLAVTVDHRIRPEGAQWARWCASRCKDFGISHVTKVWDADKPATGLPAAARNARHRILAQAAREAGARVILLGHTADDALEAGWMRAHGVRVSAPMEWSPSPVWPEGREQFLLRPLMAARREDLRAWLRDLGETWIEDPANADGASPRVRARRAIQTEPEWRVAPPPVRSPGPPPLCEGRAGELTGEARAFRCADPPTARAWLGAALVCVGGRDAPPPGKALDRLLTGLQTDARFVATLAGARLIAEGNALTLARETSDRRGGVATKAPLLPNRATIWDGRFEIRISGSGWYVTHLAGRAGRLDPASSRRLRTLSVAARRAVPALLGPAGEIICPTLSRSGVGQARALVLGRLAARCGVIAHESDLSTWRNAQLAPKSLGMNAVRPADEPS